MLVAHVVWGHFMIENKFREERIGLILIDRVDNVVV